MSFYSEMADVAIELLTEFGAAVTITRVTGRTIDPVTGVVVPGTTASLVSTGLLKKYPDKLIDGSRIQTGDRMFVLTNEVAPLLTDKFTIGGESWTAVAIETVKPTDVAIVYFVQVRK